MDRLRREIFSRNIGFITEAEQATLGQSAVAIAGVGGVGGLLAERLMRLGLGHLRITDPERFEPSNLNRQFGSSIRTLGVSKAAAVFEQLRDINPQATIEYEEAGIRSQDDANRFVAGTDMIVDEMDFGLFSESVFLQRAARRAGVYYMFASAIGFGALAVLFDPEGMTLEEYNNFDPDTAAGDEGAKVAREAICPVIPSYAASMPVEIISEVLSGERPGPTCSIGVGLASIVAANEVCNVILRKREIPVAPQYIFVDLLDQQYVVGTVR
jgi:molybdopterin/thiamine biosynthesis adenylyltransferase